MQKNKTYRELLQVKEIPPLPRTGQKILEAINDENISIEVLAKIIEQDPGLTAKIISLANSAFFANRNEIVSVHEAIVRNIGLNLAKSLALSMVISGVFRTDQCPSFSIENYWGRSILTATISSQLSRHLNKNPQSQNYFYLAGIIHDIGLLLLVYSHPEQMNEALSNHKNDPSLALIEYEEHSLSINHYEAGSFLAKKWKLPSVLFHVITHQANTDYDGIDWEIVQIINFCANWAKMLIDDPNFQPELSDALRQIGFDDEALRSVSGYCAKHLDTLVGTACRIGG